MSFQQGLSGLNTSAKQLDAIGNNVANANTVGFKQSQAQFSDLYAASLSGGGAAQVGTGSKLAGVVQQFSQGNISNTNNTNDTAISGQGFFRMIGVGGSIAYSRNGQFQVDKSGFLVNSQGHQVAGYQATAGVVSVTQGALQISPLPVAPKQTAGVVVGANLDSRAATPITPVFSPADPTSYTSSTSLTVYDSLGGNHIGSLYFQRQPIAPTTAPNIIAAGATSAPVASVTGLVVGNSITIAGAGAGVPAGNLTATITAITAGVAPAGTLTFTPATSTATAAGAVVTTTAGSPTWNAYLTVDGVLVPPQVLPAAATPLTVLTFDTLGKLAAPVGPPIGQIAATPFTPAGAAPQTLTFQFGTTAQYGGTFAVNTLSQDGYTFGQLTGYSTGADGVILGRYSNGQTQILGQIALANFTNPQGLQPMGNNEWVETSVSGPPLVGKPGTASLGILQSSAVEDSNVDLTAELVTMITAQRIYQANAQTIKTQDQVLQTLVNLR